MPSLRWGKALVAALTTARSCGGFKKEDDELLGVYTDPLYGWHIVRAVNDDATNAGFAGFIQAFILSGEAYGEVHHELPKGSRKLFPKPERRRR